MGSSWPLSIWSYVISVKEGPFSYIKELQAFRRETPDLAFLVLADKLVRKEVARLTNDERNSFTSFSQALLHVLQNCKHLWINANSEATLASLFQVAGAAPGTPSGGGKPSREADLETSKSDATPSKRMKKKPAHSNKAPVKTGGDDEAVPKAKKDNKFLKGSGIARFKTPGPASRVERTYSS